MNTCKVFIPYGAIGMGLSQKEFDRGLAMKPQVIATDAGSTDSGPYYLGTGTCKYAKEAIKRDVRQCVLGAHKLSIPVLIGSCQTCGVDSGVDEMERYVREICEAENIHGKKIVKIYTEQSPEAMQKKYLEGKIHPLGNAPEITPETFAECSHIVALGGVEPFIEALKAGADIVLCGRCTDTAIIAAMPVMLGCNESAAWHGAKVTECGAICTTKWNGGVLLTVDEEGFTVEAVAEDAACTPYTISAHMLYENANPFVLTEPNLVLDVSDAVYTQLDNGRVRATGAKHTAKPYTMKLEGAGPAGYQTISIAGIQDRWITKDPMAWLEGLSRLMTQKLIAQQYPMDDFSFSLKPYGWNAVSGDDITPGEYIPREIGVLLAVTAKTQKLATEVAKAFNPQLLHFTPQGGPMATYAFPFSPNEIEKGALYEFKLNHVVEVSSWNELVRIEKTLID